MNVPIDITKKSLIEDTARDLKKYKPGHIFCSDLMRDSATAMIIAHELNLPFELDFAARTWDVGDFEGQLLRDVNPAIAALYKSPWKTPPGSSESFNGFSERWLDYLDRKMELASKVPQFRPSVIVTHGKNLALAYSYINMENPWDGIMPLPAGFAVISINDDRSLGIEMMSETENVIEDI